VYILTGSAGRSAVAESSACSSTTISSLRMLLLPASSDGLHSSSMTTVVPASCFLSSSSQALVVLLLGHIAIIIHDGAWVDDLFQSVVPLQLRDVLIVPRVLTRGPARLVVCHGSWLLRDRVRVVVVVAFKFFELVDGVPGGRRRLGVGGCRHRTKAVRRLVAGTAGKDHRDYRRSRRRSSSARRRRRSGSDGGWHW
jgi:hypothetical protein